MTLRVNMNNENDLYMYGHFCDKIAEPQSQLNLKKKKEPGYAQFYCLFGLTVKLALTRGIHQDYKEFSDKSRRYDQLPCIVTGFYTRLMR